MSIDIDSKLKAELDALVELGRELLENATDEDDELNPIELLDELNATDDEELLDEIPTELEDDEDENATDDELLDDALDSNIWAVVSRATANT